MSKNYQERVSEWMLVCFGEQISKDRVERIHRFIEEALELAQALHCPKQDVLTLVEYVYSRPVGQAPQEVGGARVTLAALCTASDIDEDKEAEKELARIWTKIDAIRAKQAEKPKGSPLPQHIDAPKQ